jgi:hypothetical protein
MAEDAQKTLTTEEAAKRRADITKFYKAQIPHLKVQAQYEELMTQIEESRAKRLQAQAFLANAYETMESEEPEPEKEETIEKDFNKSAESAKKLKRM